MSEPWTVREVIEVAGALAHLVVPIGGIVYLRFFHPRPKPSNITEAEVLAEIDRRLALGDPRPGETRVWWRGR